MLVVHGTKKFLDRVGRPTAGPGSASTGALGSWYATVLFWRPQVALFVNEATLLPLLFPFAPATTLLQRFPGELEALLVAHGVSPGFVEREVAAAADCQLAKTANRSVLGSMNDFAFNAEWRAQDAGPLDLLQLSVDLAGMPCSPLRQRHGFPDRELAALVELHGMA